MRNKLLIILLFSFSINSYSAEKTKSCKQDKEITIGFFNGVGNTINDAKKASITSLDVIQNKYPNQKFTRELFYNDTLGAPLDLLEVFNQRLTETSIENADRIDLYWDESNNGSLTNRIANYSKIYLTNKKKLIQDKMQKRSEFLLQLIYNKPTPFIYKNHEKKLDAIIKRKEKMLFIAHSQGNLFVNQAYIYAIKKTKPDNIGVIHVAPASTVLNGQWILADNDNVINLLRTRVSGSVPDYTDNIGIPFERPAGINGKTDFMGHGFLEIYLNQKLHTSYRFDNYVNTILTKFNPNIKKQENCNPPKPNNSVNKIKTMESKMVPANFIALCDVRNCDLGMKYFFEGTQLDLDDQLYAEVSKINAQCKKINESRRISGFWNSQTSSYDISCQPTLHESSFKTSIPFKLIR